MDQELTALGANTDYRPSSLSAKGPDVTLLEYFQAPHTSEALGQVLTIQIETSEFTCLCPKTGQPDFGQLLITYRPDQRCVESKSLKLYLMGFRNHGAFHEQVISKIGQVLVDLLDPLELALTGQFERRGGISFSPSFSYEKKEWEG